MSSHPIRFDLRRLSGQLLSGVRESNSTLFYGIEAYHPWYFHRKFSKMSHPPISVLWIKMKSLKCPRFQLEKKTTKPLTIKSLFINQTSYINIRHYFVNVKPFFYFFFGRLVGIEPNVVTSGVTPLSVLRPLFRHTKSYLSYTLIYEINQYESSLFLIIFNIMYIYHLF